MVNSLPQGLNFKRNEPPSLLSDSMLLVAGVQRWPLRTLFSAKQRVLYQSQMLHELSRRSNGALSVAGSSANIVSSPSKVVALLAVEGLSCLEGEIRVVDEFYQAGVRILYACLVFTLNFGLFKALNRLETNTAFTHLWLVRL